MTETRKYQHWVVVLAAVVGLALGAVGCADKITGPGPSGKVSVSLDMKAGPAVSFRLTVTAADIDTIIVPMAASASELVTVVDVPFGPDRLFVVEGLDLAGVVLYRGEALSDVLAIQPLDLTIAMPPVVPMIYLIPHFSTVGVNNEFIITLCVNNLAGLRDLGLGLSFNSPQGSGKLFDPALIDSVTLDPFQVALGSTLSFQQEGATDVFIQLFTQTGTLVDEEGDGCLVNIHCRTQDTWLAEPFDLIPTMFIENLDGIGIPLDAVHLDNARFRVFREQATESYLGTEGDDIGVSLIPLGGGETMVGALSLIRNPLTEVLESFLYLAPLDGALQPRFERLVPWSSVQLTFGVARGNGGFWGIGTGGQTGTEVLFVDDSANEIRRENLGVDRQLFDVASRPGGGCITSGRRLFDGFHFYLAAFETDGSFIVFEPTDFSANDVYQAVIALDDTTFVAAGTKQEFSGPDQNLVLGKYTLGRGFTTVFERLTVSTGDRIASDLLVTPDGGFLVVGQANTKPGEPDDVLAIMHDSDGFPVWERVFDAQGQDFGAAVTASGDGGYVIAGSTARFAEGPRDIVVIKLSAAGDLIWQRVHGGPADELAQDITRDGSGFLITGSGTAGPNAGQDILMLRLDSEGR